MNERTLHVLEFDKVIELVKEQAATSIGKRLADAIVPATSLEKVKRLQNETDEAMTILRLNKRIPLSQIYDVTDALKRAKIGSTLSIEECLHVAQTIYTSRNVKAFIEKLEADIPLLRELVEQITSLTHIEKEIKSKIDEQGDVYDNASPALRTIRQRIRAYESSIRERLRHITKTKSKMLSDAIVTIRNDRYVLPVKQEYRAQIGGIVHDESSSGQTLFMEPNAIVDMNNKLQQAIMDEKREIDVILEKLTELIAEKDDAIITNVQTVGAVDVIHARAHVADAMKAVKPKINEHGKIDMKQARHPLIPFDEVVANDITLGDEYNAIVITGPNTGGKTVTLKMVGLCTLMAQAGLHVPALDGCELALFERIYADIGDEQSIEQNLSTFSSHMTNIVDIVNNVNDRTLVLFDEIGAGTDPQEGAALAMSILDYVIERNVRVIATTHYPELKAYGYERDGVMNASVEFNVETLQPTYRLFMGVPGRSNAFEISDRLGLTASIIDQAKAYLGVDSSNVENMIEALERSRKEAEKEIEEAHRILEESENLRRELDSEWRTFLQKRDRLFARAEEEAKQAIDEARGEAERIVGEVREMKDQTAWKEHEWIERRKQLEEAQPELVQEEKDRTETSGETQDLEVGDEITHKLLQQQGQIIAKKAKGEFVIQMGAMRVTAKQKDLLLLKRVRREEPEAPVTHSVKTSTTVKPELDLRGERYDDALHKLEQYIDDALLEGYHQVTIIHGKGTGALRKGVENFIATHPRIKSYRLGAHNEGGSGVTVIGFG